MKALCVILTMCLSGCMVAIGSTVNVSADNGSTVEAGDSKTTSQP